LSGDFALGRAPVHALTVGFFASMLVAMVTRVTHGHSGRPLQMGAIPWLTFGLLQLVVLARLWAELASNSALWLVIAAFGWLLAFAPWVLRALCGCSPPSIRRSSSSTLPVSPSPAACSRCAA
jgi:uncharacterized protein involved in response to NO